MIKIKNYLGSIVNFSIWIGEFWSNDENRNLLKMAKKIVIFVEISPVEFLQFYIKSNKKSRRLNWKKNHIIVFVVLLYGLLVDITWENCIGNLGKIYNFFFELGSNTHGMRSLKKVSYSPCLGDGRVWISTVKVFQCPHLTFYHKGPACKLQTFRYAPFCSIPENSCNCDLTIFFLNI